MTSLNGVLSKTSLSSFHALTSNGLNFFDNDVVHLCIQNDLITGLHGEEFITAINVQFNFTFFECCFNCCIFFVSLYVKSRAFYMHLNFIGLDNKGFVVLFYIKESFPFQCNLTSRVTKIIRVFQCAIRV